MNNQKTNLDALFAEARRHSPDPSRLEYGFETRLSVRIKETNYKNKATKYFRYILTSFACALIVTGLIFFSAQSHNADSEFYAQLEDYILFLSPDEFEYFTTNSSGYLF